MPAWSERAVPPAAIRVFRGSSGTTGAAMRPERRIAWRRDRGGRRPPGLGFRLAWLLAIPCAAIAAPASKPDAGPAPAAPPESAPRQPVSRIENFYYPHYKDDKDPKQRESGPVALIQGAWALVRDQDQIDLIQPILTLYHDPEGDEEGKGAAAVEGGGDEEAAKERGGSPREQAEGKKRRDKVVVRSSTGLFNQKTHQAVLEGDVVAQQEDGIEVRMDHLLVDIVHRRMTTDRRVEVRKTGLNLGGTGMEASGLLNVLVLQSTVSVSLRGSGGMEGLLGAARSAPEGGERAGGGETSVTSDGPTTFSSLKPSKSSKKKDKRDGSKLEDPRQKLGVTHELRFARPVVISHHDANGLMLLNGDVATIDLALADASTDVNAESLQNKIRRVLLTGHVKIVESQGLTGNAHRLDWVKQSALDQLDLTDDGGVRVSRGSTFLQAKRVVLQLRNGRQDLAAHCERDAEMRFAPEGAAADGKAAARLWAIRSETLDLRFQPALKGLDRVDAVGAVTIAGESNDAAAGGQTASGDRFVWEESVRRGTLTGDPAVMRQGESRMEAARILLFLLDQRVVLQGPKWIELAGPAAAEGGGEAASPAPAAAAPAKADPAVTLTSIGDVVVDTAGGVVEIGAGASAHTPQMQIEANRLKIHLAPGGGLDRALGWGKIRVVDTLQGARVFGDSLVWEARSQEIHVEGVPFAYILQPGGRLQGQAITITRQPDGLRCANRSGTKGRIQIGAPEPKRTP
jgi:lipopolysaccharide export system protein LptA